ncbi:hypothetical protein [Gluconacetobacter johannae]|uniref:Glycine zipper 2TM domain-containing protein n=1 Tax=Gluconacetobacter johannae TaxID=112140 RepID=A0A7W4J8K9_9PROT|nr:hypothetical protein [Gluconacetobacter johannae]MBB2176703.1 hypothetical protein [Gluconacetobacter johannae]
MSSRLLIVPTLALATVLSACATPGEENRADTYTADQVNARQEAQVINILAVLPARVQVDNSRNRKNAQIVGGLLGAALGAGLGAGFSGNPAAGGTLAGLGGAGAGVAGGSLVADKVLVDGVSLTYEQAGHTFNSAQVGRACEYHPGKAVMVMTSPTVTRVQPNATCPPPVKS